MTIEMVEDCPVQDMLFVKFRDLALVQRYPVAELNVGKVTPTFSVTYKKKETQLDKAQFINLIEKRMSKVPCMSPVSGSGDMSVFKWDDEINMGEIEDLAVQPGEATPTEEVQALLTKYQPKQEE